MSSVTRMRAKFIVQLGIVLVPPVCSELCAAFVLPRSTVLPLMGVGLWLIGSCAEPRYLDGTQAQGQVLHTFELPRRSCCR
jgi:hypothetical protein